MKTDEFDYHLPPELIAQHPFQYQAAKLSVTASFGVTDSSCCERRLTLTDCSS